MHIRKEKSWPSKLGAILIPLLLLVGAAVIGARSLEAVESAEHYLRVCDNPLTVEAVVTKHTSYYDSDDDERYQSYISYKVDGKKYDDIEYEDVSNSARLTPVDTQIEVQVSPEDPAVLLKTLLNTANQLYIPTIVISLLVAALWRLLLRRCRSRTTISMPDPECIQRDMALTIWARFPLSYFFLQSVSLLLLYCRYAVFLQPWTLIATVICGVIWLLYLINAIRQLQCVQCGDYTTCWDTLVKKEVSSDSESDTYTFYYRNSERVWSKNVTQREYNSTEENTKVFSVYLPGKKKPTVHYSIHGEAC